MKNEKWKTKKQKLFWKWKKFWPKKFFLQNLFKSQGFQRLEMKNEKNKNKNFFLEYHFGLFPAGIPKWKNKVFFALGQKWKMKNEKQKTFFWIKSFFKVFICYFWKKINNKKNEKNFISNQAVQRRATGSPLRLSSDRGRRGDTRGWYAIVPLSAPPIP